MMESLWVEQLAHLLLLVIVHGTALAVLTWIICSTVLRRARPSLHVALWTIVLLKFVFPPVIPGLFSLSGWLSGFTAVLGISEPVEATEVGLGLVETSDLTAALGTSGSSSSWGGPLAWIVANSLAVGLLVYGLIVCGLLIRSVYRTAGVWTYVGGLPAASPGLSSRVKALARLIGLRKAPEVKSTADEISPFVIGAMHPTLVLPDQLERLVSSEILDAMILHELAHLKRGDLWIRWIQSGARLVLFFWPPVRWVCRRIEEATEQACDLWAIRSARVAPGEYARSLLGVVRRLGGTPLMTRRLALMGKECLLEERFKMLLRRNHQGNSPKLAWVMIPGLFVWSLFALSGTGGPVAAGSEEPHEQHRKAVQVRELVVKPAADLSEVRLSASILPEADSDANGQVTVMELEAYLEAHPGAYELAIDPTEDGEGFKITITQETEDPHSEHGLEWTAETDHELDIEVLETDETGGKKVKVIKRRLGEGKVVEEVLEDELEIVAESEGTENVFLIKMDGHPEHADGEGKEIHMVYVNSPEEFLERHPEADTNGDGELSEDELESFAAQLAEHHEVDFTSSVHQIEAEHGEGVFNVHLPEGGKEGAHLIWIGDGHGPTGDGKQITVETMIAEDGKHVIVLKETDSQNAPQVSVDRTKDFLAEHPEADADGDGVISKKEAEAFAAKLQLERKKKE